MAKTEGAQKEAGSRAGDKPAAGKPAAKRSPASGASAPKGGKRVRVTLVRSVNGTRESHRATVRGLGLRHRHHTVELEDTPAVRGMINKVSYLLKVEA
jgi:large subunit ribosomal protein L30